MKIGYLKDYPDHLPILAEWSFDTWSKYNPSTTRNEHIEKFTHHCQLDALPLTLTALNENEIPIGMCSLREAEGVRSEPTPWLGSVYVLPNYRKQKVGKKLIEATQRIAKRMHFDRLYLLTFEQEINPYYVQLGWELMGKDSLNGNPVSIMEIGLT